ALIVGDRQRNRVRARRIVHVGGRPAADGVVQPMRVAEIPLILAGQRGARAEARRQRVDVDRQASLPRAIEHLKNRGRSGCVRASAAATGASARATACASAGRSTRGSTTTSAGVATASCTTAL